MKNAGRVLAWITPAVPFGFDPPESPVDRAAQSALMAVADFFVAIKTVTTTDEALKLHRVIEEVLASVDCASRAALERADQLCGKVS